VSLVLRRLLALAVAALLAALPPLLEQAATPEPAWRLGQARFSETVDDVAALTVDLPHRWASACPDCRTVWYGFPLSLAEPPRDARLIYLPAAGQNAAIYLNGRLLAQGGRFSEPMARLGARPLSALAPPSLWNAGDNRLYVLVKADRPASGFLAAPAIGTEDALASVVQWRRFLVQTLPQGLAAVCAMLALVMGLIAFYRRQAPGYRVLAIAAALQALQAWSIGVVEPPIAGPVWDAGLAAAQVLAAAAVCLLAVHLNGGAARAWAWPAATAAAALAGMAVVLDRSGLAFEAASRVPLFASVVAGAWLAAPAWRQPDLALGVAGLLLAVLSGADLLRIGFDPGAAPFQAWGLLLFFGAAAWQLLLGFLETLNTLELLNIDLEALVQVRTTELQAQFERVRELERRQTLAAERERLMRDMHDGVGGHLVSLLGMIDTGRSAPDLLRTAVRDALDDMRLMIDSLEPVDDDFNAVLAMWHDRLGPRLRAAGITLHWDVDLLPAVSGLTPARVLHVLRILQEAVTNAVRHGQAQCLWLSAMADVDAGTVQLSLRDDGGGFEPATAASGRGLKNMRHRAHEVGARVDVRSAPGQGTHITLVLPLVRTRPA
jgi:signal transduction histidine kinase